MFNRRGFGMLPAVALSLAITGGIFSLLGYIRSLSKASVRVVTLMEYGVVTKSIAESFAMIISKGSMLDKQTLAIDNTPISLADAAKDPCWMGRLLMTEGMVKHEKGYNATLGRDRNDLTIMTGRAEAGAEWCGTKGWATENDGEGGLYMMVKKTDVLGGTQMKPIMDVLEKTDPHFGGIVLRAVRRKSIALPSDIDGTILEITASVIPASTLDRVMGTRRQVRHKITRLFMRHNLMEYALVTPGRLRMDQDYATSTAANSKAAAIYKNSDISNYVGDISIPFTTITEFANNRNSGITFHSPILINGDVTLPPPGKAVLANFRKPIEMGKGTLMRGVDGALAPYTPTMASSQIKGTLDELRTMMRGNAGFVALGERSTALDVLYGIAPGSVGSLARTCLDNLKNFDPTESAKSCLVIKEIPSRSISSNTANPVALTTQTQNFLGAYTNENNEFVPQDGPGNNRGTGAWIKQVSGSTEQNFESATVTTGSSKDRAFPIYKVVVALRNSAGVVAAVPDQTFNRVEADIGLEQTLSVKFAPDVTRCDPESLETQINETNTAKKAAEEARDALFPPNSKPREMSEYLDDVFSAVQKAVDPNNGQGNPGQGNPGQGNPGQGGPGQSDPAQPHNKLDSPDLAKWYSDNSSGHHLTTTSDLATVVKYVQDHIDTSFGPSGKELKGYLSESDYKLAAYGCTTCTPVEKAFQDFFKRVHFEALKQLASKYDKKAKDLAVQDTYIKNPFTVELTVKPQLVDSDKGGQEVQPNMAKLGVVMRNVESWKACGKDGDFTPDISLIGYELGYDGSKIESSGRQAHPLWSNVNRLYWKFNTTGDKLDLQNSATLSSSFQAMNPNFPRAPSGSDPGTPSSPGTPPSETRNYAAERRACEDVGDYRFGNVGQEDFDLLAQVAWHFSDDGDTDTNLIVENNTVDTLVHPDVKGDYSWPIHTGLTSITVKDTADILVGNYVTQTMKIEDRSTPLMIVATVLTKKLTIHPNALKAGITWIAPQDDAALPVLTRAVLGRGMNCSVLKNAASIAGAPLWHPNLKLMSSNNSDISARMAMSCTLASFAPKMGEAFSSTNGSPPMTPNLTTAVSRMDMNQYFKGAWGIKPVAEDQSEVWY